MDSFFKPNHETARVPNRNQAVDNKYIPLNFHLLVRPEIVQRSPEEVQVL